MDNNREIFKVAYLILAHDNYNNLQRLISSLENSSSVFFIHIDNKSKMPVLKSSSKIIFIERTKIFWAGFSIVEATLRLIKKAFEGNFNRYVLLSGTHLPITNNNNLFTEFRTDKEFIVLNSGFSKQKPKTRFTRFHFNNINRRKRIFKLINPIESVISLFVKNNKIDLDKIYQGSQWWALTNDCIKHILDFIDNHPDFLELFKHFYCPDESFFHTIVGNSKFSEKGNHKTTYANWKEKEKPAILSENKLINLTQYNPDNYLFARKFTDL